MGGEVCQGVESKVCQGVESKVGHGWRVRPAMGGE